MKNTISKLTPVKMEKVKALIIRTAGTNCDQETIHALEQAGAQCELVHINQILTGRTRLHPYQMLVIPGGFSYGDDIAAGKVLANELRFKLADQLKKFIEAKKLVIGICNGFQVLVKTGLLPGFETIDDSAQATLTLNDSGQFQCEWIKMKTEKSAAEWLSALPPTVEFPIAHGEGKFVTASPAVLKNLKKNNQIIFRYHPTNPNGSVESIAGICNKTGNVVGLMPHPERYLTRYQHPNWPSLESNENSEWGDGYLFWKQAVDYAKNNLN